MLRLHKEFIKFCAVGTVSTTINYLIFFISYTYIEIYYVMASGMGYIVGVSLGYVLNRRWTFFENQSHTRKLREFTMYILVYIASLAIGLSATTNFMGLKFCVFKKSNAKTIW